MFQEAVTDTTALQVGLKQRFAAIDLAPNEQLETGFCVVDRDRHILRMDKLFRDEDIIQAIQTIGPPTGTLVVIDMPKNLSVSSRWRQEAIKMHPFQASAAVGSRKSGSRFEARGFRLYDQLKRIGVVPLLSFNAWSRLNYQLAVPFRTRSAQGCRALQTAIEYQLDLKNLPTNLPPSSVLDAMVGCYAAWSVWAGDLGPHFEIHQDEQHHMFLIPKGFPHLVDKPKMAPRRRYQRGRITSRRPNSTNERTER